MMEHMMKMPPIFSAMEVTISEIDNGWLVRVQSKVDGELTYCKDAEDILKVVETSLQGLNREDER